MSENKQKQPEQKTIQQVACYKTTKFTALTSNNQNKTIEVKLILDKLLTMSQEAGQNLLLELWNDQTLNTLKEGKDLEGNNLPFNPNTAARRLKYTERTIIPNEWLTLYRFKEIISSQAYSQLLAFKNNPSIYKTLLAHHSYDPVKKWVTVNDEAFNKLKEENIYLTSLQVKTWVKRFKKQYDKSEPFPENYTDYQTCPTYPRILNLGFTNSLLSYQNKENTDKRINSFKLKLLNEWYTINIRTPDYVLLKHPNISKFCLPLITREGFQCSYYESVPALTDEKACDVIIGVDPGQVKCLTRAVIVKGEKEDSWDGSAYFYDDQGLRSKRNRLLREAEGVRLKAERRSKYYGIEDEKVKAYEEHAKHLCRKASRLNTVMSHEAADIVKQLADYYKREFNSNVIVAYENTDFTHEPDFVKNNSKGKKQNFENSHWFKGLLREKLEHKLSYSGVELIQTPAAYTSQTCPSCDNKLSLVNEERYHSCSKCGYKEDKDVTGALNHASLLSSNLSKVKRVKGRSPVIKTKLGKPVKVSKQENQESENIKFKNIRNKKIKKNKASIESMVRKPVVKISDNSKGSKVFNEIENFITGENDSSKVINNDSKDVRVSSCSIVRRKRLYPDQRKSKVIEPSFIPGSKRNLNGRSGSEYRAGNAAHAKVQTLKQENKTSSQKVQNE